jgi:hypothetical protein
MREAWRHNGRLLPGWVSFTRVWGSRGAGRWWKRRLSKARRRAWRDTHKRGLSGVESTVNWKDW